MSVWHDIKCSYLVYFYYVNAGPPGHKIILITITPVSAHTVASCNSTKLMGDFYGIYKALMSCLT